MPALRLADYRRAFDVVNSVSAAASLDEFARLAIDSLRQLVPSDIVSLNELNPGRHRAMVRAEPMESLFEGAGEALERHLDEHPIVDYQARTRDLSVVRLSDFITRRQLHRTGLYAELYRPIEGEYLIVTPLDLRAPRLVGFAHFRSHGDFGERDRMLLELVREPLARAYRHAEQREVLAALEHVGPDADVGVIVATLDGELVHQTPAAERLLESEDVSVTRVSSATAARQVFVVRRRPVPNLLTPRESEVMRYVAVGLTNAQIADALAVQPATVKKHLERVYAKLGVSNRTAAVTAARR